jgi:hypothetical protein
MAEQNNESRSKFESIHALIRQIHGGSSNSLANDEREGSIQRSLSDRSVSSLNTLPILEIEKPQLRKRSMFEGAFRIPRLMITGPHSSPLDSICTLEESPHRRFSFGHFRRHSHSPVRVNESFFSCFIVSLAWESTIIL